MAAYSAMIQGASQVMVVDRLKLAEQIGAIAIDDSKGTEENAAMTAMTLNNLVRSVRFTGHIGVVGIVLPQDTGVADEHFDNRDDGWTKVLLEPTMAS